MRKQSSGNSCPDEEVLAVALEEEFGGSQPWSTNAAAIPSYPVTCPCRLWLILCLKTRYFYFQEQKLC
jgi:hypothetical protein